MTIQDASDGMAEFISRLPGRDKISLANYFGVTLREVERWSSTSPIANRRNFIPKTIRFESVWDLDPEDLRDLDLDARWNGYILATNQCYGEVDGAHRTGFKHVGTGSLHDILDLAEVYRRGESGDPFYDTTVVEITISPEGGRWGLVIGYAIASDNGELVERQWFDDFLE